MRLAAVPAPDDTADDDVYMEHVAGSSTAPPLPATTSHMRPAVPPPDEEDSGDEEDGDLDTEALADAFENVMRITFDVRAPY